LAPFFGRDPFDFSHRKLLITPAYTRAYAGTT
jgi:hypothetical protein